MSYPRWPDLSTAGRRHIALLVALPVLVWSLSFLLQASAALPSTSTHGGIEVAPPTTASSSFPAPPQLDAALAESSGPFVTYNTYPGAAQAQWGKYSIALEREGRYYLLSAGHVGGKIGARAQLSSTHAVVSYSTKFWDTDYTRTVGGSGLDMSMIDVGTAPLAPRLRLSSGHFALTEVTVPVGTGSGQISLPQLATISAVAGDLDSGAVVCQSGADWYASEYTTSAHNVRCGRLSAPCVTTDPTCSFVSSDSATPAVSANDSGNPVWVPRADGTIDVLGIVYAAGCGGGHCTEGLLTRVEAYVNRKWTPSETLPTLPRGPGGRIVVAASSHR